jgi:hypothetical protein
LGELGSRLRDNRSEATANAVNVGSIPGRDPSFDTGGFRIGRLSGQYPALAVSKYILQSGLSRLAVI